ncbi:rhodanese-like domain-containing protein [Glaciecola sp. 33A]|jgi:phage shock protein E|nr:rhodanese-like domain-containing protein [Glaciecola sp. 33A]
MKNPTLINRTKTLFNLMTCLCLFFISAAVMASKDISPETMLAMEKSERLLLDVRTVEEYTNSHIPTSVNIPLNEIGARLSRLSDFKDSPVVVYCRTGTRAAKAITLLEDNGFTNVMHLEGDMVGWEAQQRQTNQLGK